MFFNVEQLKQPLTELDFVFFDTETTGISFDKGHDLIEIALVRTKDTEIVDVYESRIKPVRLGQRVRISPDAMAVHGIMDWELDKAPTFEEVYPEVVKRLPENAILIAHNAPFDLRFLKGKMTECKLAMPENTTLCSLKLSRAMYPEQKHSLEVLRDRYAVKAADDAHSALGDTRALVEIFFKLIYRGLDKFPVTLGDVVNRHGKPLSLQTV